jgi:DNA-binding NarL/FixJ family response regulator
MNIPIYTVTADQVRVVAQPTRYQGGVPVAYRCGNCDEWHPHDAPKLYDRATGRYHGADCAGADTLLTPRQLAVLDLLARGHTDAAIARTLTVSRGTVGNHVGAIYRALGLTWGAEAPRAAATRWHARHVDSRAA